MNKNDLKIKVVEVKKSGEERGFCREYYNNIHTNQIYARQEVCKNDLGIELYSWHTTTKSGEPDSPLRKDLLIVIHNEDGTTRVIELYHNFWWGASMEKEANK